MRPPSIVNFERFFLAAVLVSLVTTLLSWDDTVSSVQSQPGVELGQGFVIGVTVAGVIIQLLLWYFIARQPRAWAKWIFVILFVLNLALTVLSFVSGSILPTVILILTLTSLGLRALATWMLFKPDAAAWFGQAGAASNEGVR